jgi:hypothetical protein
MKRGYNKILYNQRKKDETIVSVIKRLFGEHITSRLIRMQNRELTFRCIAHNTHRMVKLVVLMMHSSIKKSLMERVNQYFKDRTENFDDYYTCMQQKD